MSDPRLDEGSRGTTRFIGFVICSEASQNVDWARLDYQAGQQMERNFLGHHHLLMCGCRCCRNLELREQFKDLVDVRDEMGKVVVANR